MTLCPELRRLTAEHARWLAQIERRERGGEPGRAAGLLALWEGEILPHCRREEDVLLPELARRIPEADAAIVFTLGDHVVLRRLVRELREADVGDRCAAADRLARKLAEHVEFEERTLFPALQETLGCDVLATLGSELAGDEPKRRHRPVDGPPAAREVKRKGTEP